MQKKRGKIMLKLIIADDEPAIRTAISTIIDWKAMQIDLIGTCKNGPQALNMILEKKPDIVLTDIRMPGMSGLDLIAKVAETNLIIEFIILSGYADFEYAKQAIKYRVSNYLLKPCNENQVMEAVQKAALEIRRRKKINELIPEKVLTQSGERTQYKDYINQILDYVDNHFSDSDLSLKWIASNVLYMNEDYLSREFLRQTGQKFTEYVTNLRITKAKALLSQTGYDKISVIANQVGFSNNPQYFVQIFKNATGMTPRSYAKYHAEKSS